MVIKLCITELKLVLRPRLLKWILTGIRLRAFIILTIAASISCFLSSSTLFLVSLRSGSDSPFAATVWIFTLKHIFLSFLKKSPQKFIYMHIYTEHNYGEINCTSSIPMWVLSWIFWKKKEDRTYVMTVMHCLRLTPDMNTSITTSIEVVIWADCHFTVIKTTETGECSLSRQEWKGIFRMFNKKKSQYLKAHCWDETLIHDFTEYSLEGQLFLGGKQFNDQLLLMPSVIWDHVGITTVAFLECCVPSIANCKLQKAIRKKQRGVTTGWVVHFAL